MNQITAAKRPSFDEARARIPNVTIFQYVFVKPRPYDSDERIKTLENCWNASVLWFECYFKGVFRRKRDLADVVQVAEYLRWLEPFVNRKVASDMRKELD